MDYTFTRLGVCKEKHTEDENINGVLLCLQHGSRSWPYILPNEIHFTSLPSVLRLRRTTNKQTIGYKLKQSIS